MLAFQLDALDAAHRTAVLDQLVGAIGSRLDGMSEPAAEVELIRILSIGTFRLDDATLVRRLELETKELLGVGTATCAAIAAGRFQMRGDDPRLTDLVATLSPDERLEQATITVAAIRAEVLGQAEPRTLTSAERTQIVSAIAKAAPADELQRIHDLSVAAAAGQTLSDDDACWLMRAPYRALDRLPADERALLARYVLGPMSG